MNRRRSVNVFIGIQLLYSAGMIAWAIYEYMKRLAPTSYFQLPEIFLGLVIPVEVMTGALAFLTHRGASREVWGAWVFRWVLGFFLGVLLLWMPEIYTGPWPPPPTPPRLLWGAYFETFMSLISLAWLFADKKEYQSSKRRGKK